jgi:phage terminase large subunit-like protein
LELRGYSLSLQEELLTKFTTRVDNTDGVLKAHYAYMVKMLEKAMDD